MSGSVSTSEGDQLGTLSAAHHSDLSFFLHCIALLWCGLQVIWWGVWGVWGGVGRGGLTLSFGVGFVHVSLMAGVGA